MSQFGHDRHEYDDDEYDGPDDDICECSDAELDWEGYFQCTSCNRRWDATPKQMAEYWQSYEDYHRPPSMRDHIREWWVSVLSNIRRRFRNHSEIAFDDDIPF